MAERSYLSHYDPTAFRLGVEAVAQVQERRAQQELELQKEQANQQAEERRAALQLKNFAAEQAILNQNKAAEELADAKDPVKARQRVWSDNFALYGKARQDFLSNADAILKDPRYDPDYKKKLSTAVTTFQNQGIAEPDVTDEKNPAWVNRNFSQYLPQIPTLGEPVLTDEELLKQKQANEKGAVDLDVAKARVGLIKAQTNKANNSGGPKALTDAQLRANGKLADTGFSHYLNWVSSTPIYSESTVKQSMAEKGYDPSKYNFSQLSDGERITNPKAISWLKKRGVEINAPVDKNGNSVSDVSASKFREASSGMHRGIMALLPESLRGEYQKVLGAFGGAREVGDFDKMYNKLKEAEGSGSPGARAILNAVTTAGAYTGSDSGAQDASDESAPAPTEGDSFE